MKNRKLVTLFLTIACLGAGYTFYRMNPHDLFPSIIFTVGILGILLSVLRESKK